MNKKNSLLARFCAKNRPKTYPRKTTLATSNGEFLNPFRDVQIYEKLDGLEPEFYNLEEWELPLGAAADMAQGEPTNSFSQELSGQLARSYARFVWPKEIPGHVNPGASEKGTGGLYQFASKASFSSELREGYQASIFLRMSGWASGARRRGNDERKLYMCSGYPFRLFNAHSIQYEQLSASAFEMEWKQAKPYSYVDPADVGLTSSSWASFPKAAAPALTPTRLEMEHTDVLINFPSCLSRPAMAKRGVNVGGPPSPPPRKPESSWDVGHELLRISTRRRREIF